MGSVRDVLANRTEQTDQGDRRSSLTGRHVRRQDSWRAGPAIVGSPQLKKPPVTGMPGEAAVQDSAKTGAWQKRLA